MIEEALALVDDGLARLTRRSALAALTAAAAAPAARGGTGGVISPLDFGAVRGGPTGSAARDLAIAARNHLAFARAIEALSGAAKGGGRPTLVVPGAFLLAMAPFAGAAPPRPGVSARGGGHWRGPSYLPRSGGWSCHGLVIDGVRGFRIAADGGRLIAIENDPFNTGTGSDDTNSMVFVSRCRDFRIDGDLAIEGYQEGRAHGATSGNGIDVSYGCTDFAIEKLWWHKGSNAVVIGQNRASGFSPRGVTGIDPTQPCVNWEVGAIEAYDGEHAVLVNIADAWTIGSIAHDHRAYGYAGVAQSDYMMRTLYVLGAGRGHVGSVRSIGAAKTGVHVAAYDATRTNADTVLRIDDIMVQGRPTQKDDHHVAVQVDDHNVSMQGYRTVSLDIGRLVARAVKVGVMLRDDGVPGLETGGCLKRLHVAAIDVQATGAGVRITPTGVASDIRFAAGTITVRADPATSAMVPDSGFTIARNLGGSDGKARPASVPGAIRDVAIGTVTVTSGNRVCRLRNIAGLSIDGAVFRYQPDPLVQQPNSRRLVVSDCGPYGVMRYRTDDGSRAVTDGAPGTNPQATPLIG